jgi:hypothetical protein
MNDQAAGSDWTHLRRYGYAPGHYMNTCLACKQTVIGVDKRAHICRPCAERLHAEEAAAVTSSMRAG